MNRKGEPFFVHQEGFSIPFIGRAGEIAGAAELFFVARDLPGLGLAQQEAVLAVELDDQFPVLYPKVL